MLRQSTFPRGGGRLNRLRTLCCVHFAISSEGVAEAEKSPTEETKPIVHDYPQTLARGGSPPRNPLRKKRNQTYTITPKHSPAVAHRREIPCGRNGTPHTRASPLAGGGSSPRNPLRKKRNQTYTTPPNTRRRRLTALARGFGRTPLAHDNKNYLKKCRNRSNYV